MDVDGADLIVRRKREYDRAMESMIGRNVIVTAHGQRVRGVVVGHRSEADAPAVASVNYGDQWFVRYDTDQEEDPGEGGFHFEADMEFSE